MPPKRTVIGSFPSRIAELGLDGAIKWAVDLQLKYGIQVVTDGEQRGNIIDYFEQIPGLGRRFGRPAIIGKIKPVEDLDNFPKISDCRKVLEYLESLGVRGVEVKVTVTGPVTLGFTYGMGGLGPYSSILDERLYLDLAYALNPLIEKAVKIGCYIQWMSRGSWQISSTRNRRPYSRRILREHKVRERGNSPCMRFFKRYPKLIYDMLLKLQVDVLSLAFSGRREETNLQMISREAFEEHGKSWEQDSSQIPRLSLSREPLRRLSIISDKVGIENIAYLHPDCGFRGTPLDIVKDILRNMKEASSIFLSEVAE